MSHGSPAIKLATTVDSDVHAKVVRAASREHKSVSAWVTADAIPRRILVFIAAGLWACGSTGQVPAELPDGGIDAHDFRVGPPATGLHAPIHCSPGSERIEIYDGTSTHVLTGSCPGVTWPWATDAGIPTAGLFLAGEDGPLELGIIGCDNIASFFGQAMGPVPGTLAGGIEYAAKSPNALITVDTWPDAGGLVSGSYTTSSSLSGVFCARRVE